MFGLSESSVVGKQAGDSTLEHVGPRVSEAKQLQMWPAALNSHKQTKPWKFRVSRQFSEETGEGGRRCRCHHFMLNAQTMKLMHSFTLILLN